MKGKTEWGGAGEHEEVEEGEGAEKKRKKWGLRKWRWTGRKLDLCLKIRQTNL